MTLEQADALIATYLSSNWTATLIAWENVDPRAFSMPGQPLLPDGTADYLQVRSYEVSNRTVTIPAHCIRSHVQLQISVCVKAGSGVRKAKKASPCTARSSVSWASRTSRASTPSGARSSRA